MMENGSNRSSGSSGNYGHLVEHHSADYDNIYTKPTVLKELLLSSFSFKSNTLHELTFKFNKHAEECIMETESKNPPIFYLNDCEYELKTRSE